MIRRKFVPSMRGRINKFLKGKVSYYLINIIKKLDIEIFYLDLLNHIYERLPENSQNNFNYMIIDFLNQNKPKDIVDLLNKKNLKLDDEDLEDDFKLPFIRKEKYVRNENKLFEQIKETYIQLNYHDYSRDYKKVEYYILNLLPKEAQKNFIQRIIQFIREESKIQNTSSKEEKRAFKKKLIYLKKFLNLSEIEILIIEYAFYISSSEAFADIVAEIIKNYDIFKTLSIILNVEEIEIKQAIQKDSKLQVYGIIDIADIFEIYLNEDIYDYLSSFSNLDFTDKFFRVIDPQSTEEQEEILDLDLFHFYQNKIDLVQKLLTSECGTNILFYGKSGTGKTSLAKSIIKSLNKKIIYVSSVNSSKMKTNSLGRRYREEESSNRIFSLIMACNYAKDHQGIVIMDEADEFLNSHFSSFGFFMFPVGSSRNSTNVQKNWINEFLESHDYKIIWITNHIRFMDESVKRRFQYSIQFTTFNGETREYIINKILQKYKMDVFLSMEDLKEYFLDPSIPIGIIDNSLKQIQLIIKNQNITKEEIINYARELLNSSYELVYNHTFKPTWINNKEIYSIDFINCKPSSNDVLEKIERFIYINKNKEKNLNCLFYGVTGTGKTEFARFVASQINYRVIEITPSDVHNPFFGVSEQLIRDYFKQASNGNSILIVNEIDVFLSKDRISQGVYSSIEMQFIQEMENFKGILIGTTNSIDKLPPRVKRRFHLKVEFLPIKKEKIVDIFLSFFKEKLVYPELSNQQEQKLKELNNICIGDFYAVKRKIELEGEQYFEEIYKYLKEEMYYRLHDKN